MSHVCNAVVVLCMQSAQSADSRSDKSGHDVVQSFTAGLRRRSDTHYGPQVCVRVSCLHSRRASRTTETLVTGSLQLDIISCLSVCLIAAVAQQYHAQLFLHAFCTFCLCVNPLLCCATELVCDRRRSGRSPQEGRYRVARWRGRPSCCVQLRGQPAPRQQGS
jgi:hypothetical protein